MGIDVEKIVNTKATFETLIEGIDYVAGKTVDDEYVKKLDEAVRKARANKEWRREYMTLMMRDLENATQRDAIVLLKCFAMGRLHRQ